MANFYLFQDTQLFDNNGNPLNAGTVSTFAAGTVTPLASYTDSTGATPGANPVVLDSAGRAQIWLSANAYKFVIKNSAGATIATIDGYNPTNVATTVSSLTDTGDLTLQQTVAATGGANQSSNNLKVQGTYWDGAASQTDTWTIQDVLGAGANPTTTLTVSHAGSSGTAAISFTPPVTFANLTAGNLTVTGNETIAGTLGVTGVLTASAANILKAKTFNNIRYADQFAGANAGVQITAAIADLPSTGGIVDATGYGATIQTISAQLDIGAAGKPVTLRINPGVQFQITTINSATTDAIRIWNGSHIEGIGAGGVIGVSNQSNFTVMSGCVVRSILANWPQDGTVEFCSASNLTLRSNTGSTVAKGLLYISGIFSGSYFRDVYTVFNGGGGSSLYITAPTGGSINLTTDVNFYNCNFDGGSASGGGPAVTITPLAVGSGISSINFVNCQIQHPGSTQPILNIDGAGSSQVGDINFFGLHLESGAALATTGPYAALTDCHSVNFYAANTSGAAPTAGNGITIAQTAANSTWGISLKSFHQVIAITNMVSSSVTGIPTYAFVADPDTTMYISDWDPLPRNKAFGTMSLLGSTSGQTKINANAVASGTLTLPAATDTLVGKATTDTLTNKTLTSPVVNGTPTGTGIPTVTLKKGTGAGNYNGTNTTYSDVDATNLGYTVTIPTGWKLHIQVNAVVFNATATSTVNLALIDGSVIVENQVTGPLNFTVSSTLGWVINGDGNSHTIKLQAKTTAGADAWNIFNDTATRIPTMTFILTPSN